MAPDDHPATGSHAVPCPFQPAASKGRRLKLFLWGEPGVGKTTLALQFPRPAVLDLEGGTDLYGRAFQFDVLSASGPDQVMQAVDWLATHPHEFCTLIIDPVTVYWDALQAKWSSLFLKRNKGTKGHKFEFYDFQPRDWMTIKAELKELIRKLIALDLNVIVTARLKPQYADSGFMKVIGATFDGEKTLPYSFDTVLQLSRDDRGRFLARCLKDRSNRLPAGEFEISYPLLEEAFGKDELSRPARLASTAPDRRTARIRELIAYLGLPTDKVRQRLAAYGVTRLRELSDTAADEILAKLEVAAGAAAQTNHQTEGDR